MYKPFKLIVSSLFVVVTVRIYTKANFLHHKWQSDTIKIGEVPKDFVAKISNNLFNDTIDVEVNKYFWEDDYDLILSIAVSIS